MRSDASSKDKELKVLQEKSARSSGEQVEDTLGEGAPGEGGFH